MVYNTKHSVEAVHSSSTALLEQHWDRRNAVHIQYKVNFPKWFWSAVGQTHRCKMLEYGCVDWNLELIQNFLDL